MATDLKKHTTFGAGETPSRAALAAAILSISDIVPVANATERNQIATDLIAAGISLATKPLVVARADARGLHRIEYSYNGTVWIPASGILEFANEAAAASFASSNGALLTAGDVCRISGVEYVWSGTAWSPRVPTATLARSADLPNGVSASASAAPFQTAPTALGMTWAVGNPSRLVAPVAGLYLIDAFAAIGSTTNGTAYIRVNGATDSKRRNVQPQSGGGLAEVPVLDHLTLAAGDYIELMVQSNNTFTLFAATKLNATLIARR